MALLLLRRAGSNHRPSGYEPDELPLLYSAMYISFEIGYKGTAFFWNDQIISYFFRFFTEKRSDFLRKTSIGWGLFHSCCHFSVSMQTKVVAYNFQRGEVLES